MESRKIYTASVKEASALSCEVCDVEFSTIYNLNKHFKTKKHLENKELREVREWVGKNHIYKYENLTINELRNIKQNFNAKSYNLFNNEKLIEIGTKLSIKNLENLPRGELINKIQNYKKELNNTIYKDDNVIIEEKKTNKE